LESSLPVIGLPDPGTKPQFYLRGKCSPHQGSNNRERVSWDHGCETEIPGHLPHPDAHGLWTSVVQVPLLIHIKEDLISTLFRPSIKKIS